MSNILKLHHKFPSPYTCYHFWGERLHILEAFRYKYNSMFSRSWISWSYCNLSTPQRHVGGGEVEFQSSLTPYPCRFLSGKTMVTFIQVTSWVPETAWTFLRRETFLFLAGIRTLDRPAPPVVAIPTSPPPCKWNLSHSLSDLMQINLHHFQIAEAKEMWFKAPLSTYLVSGERATCINIKCITRKRGLGVSGATRGFSTLVATTGLLLVRATDSNIITNRLKTSSISIRV
jgi:hypothetical protein